MEDKWDQYVYISSIYSIAWLGMQLFMFHHVSPSPLHLLCQATYVYDVGQPAWHKKKLEPTGNWAAKIRQISPWESGRKAMLSASIRGLHPDILCAGEALFNEEKSNNHQLWMQRTPSPEPPSGTGTFRADVQLAQPQHSPFSGTLEFDIAR